jgi:hypothetical protein
MTNDSNPYAPPEARVAEVAQIGGTADSAPAPPLWNPGAASAWSLLFTPIFGAILQMKNWQALGAADKAATSRAWAIGCAIYFVLSGVSLVFLPESAIIDRIANLLGLVLVLIWYFADGREQVRHVRARFGKAYPRRGWWLPLLFALGAFVAYLVMFTGIALAIMTMRGEL